jgi:CubicO group peptidase (beta-lactamase class C family)
MTNKWETFSADLLLDPINAQSIYDVKDYLDAIIEKNMIPGAVILVAKEGKTVLYESFGYQQLIPATLPMEKTMMFDLASLTKIVCTWAAILKLIEYNKIELTKEVKYYLDIPNDVEFGNSTIEQILKHTSGLPERTFLKQYGNLREDIIRGICYEPLAYERDRKVVYSNRGFIILGEIVEIVSGKNLYEFVRDEVWLPLGMENTFFKPPVNLYNNIVPTEYPNEIGECQRGIVHDENAAWLGGIAGHAGVFSDVIDLAKFCSMVMQGGKYNGNRILDSDLVNESLSNKTVGLNESRGYGWVVYGEKDNYYYGHTGFTGTGLWLNTQKDMFMILLTNRVHPSRERFTSIKEIRQQVLNKSWKIY